MQSGYPRSYGKAQKHIQMTQRYALDFLPRNALGDGPAFWIFFQDSRIRVKNCIVNCKYNYWLRNWMHLNWKVWIMPDDHSYLTWFWLTEIRSKWNRLNCIIQTFILRLYDVGFIFTPKCNYNLNGFWYMIKFKPNVK